MPAPSPIIANEFIKRASAAGQSLTQMQLQKLVYIAHGWNLAINRAPLTDDQPEAWDYGPVYRDLYGALGQYGRTPVSREIRRGEFGGGVFLDEDEQAEVASATLEPKETALIDRVFREYGKFHAFKLSALTHQEGTPWSEVYRQGLGRFQEIDNDRIRKHFIGLAARRG